MERIDLKAFAKINLGLDVLGKREDGYHEVRMIMQTISMYDQITIEKSSSSGILLSSDSDFAPADPTNLAYRAAKAVIDYCGLTSGVKISLHKFIPVAAGMAGGSTDAASVLYGMNRLFDLGLTQKKLMELALPIGADVPYCVMRGTALAEGIGEKLTRLSPCPFCYMLIVKPPIGVSTKEVYTALDMSETPHPDIDGIMDAIRVNDLYRMAPLMGNVLQTVTIPMHPEIQDIIDGMKRLGAIGAMMSGSGPTVFGLFDREETCASALSWFRKNCPKLRSYETQIENIKERNTHSFSKFERK